MGRPDRDHRRTRLRILVAVAVLVACAITAMVAFAAKPVMPAKDSDGDGLSDAYERSRSHTRVRLGDTDRDGLSDGGEVMRSHTNPRRKDTDRDGLDDRLELKRTKTDPRKRDSDGDRIPDGTEVNRLASDPRRKDSDRDGLLDGAEVHRYGTSPVLADTDGDGYHDSQEVFFHSNPRDGNSPGAAPVASRLPPPPPAPPTGPPPTTPGDATPPQTTIRTGPAGSTTSPGATFSFSASEGGSTFACRLDAGAWIPCSSPRAYPSVGLGQHVFAVRATDGAGNTDLSPATRTWMVLATPPPPPQDRPVRPCSQTLGSLDAVQSALDGAAPGAVICLANGSYGQLTLNATKSAEVTVQPATSGGATIAGALLDGSHLTLEGFVVSGEEVTVQPGSDHMTIQFNQITGGYFGVQAGPTTTTTVDDVTIRGNRFVGPFGEDAIRLNRYHDGPDADEFGALVEGNEFTNVRENGNHSDCLQAVWVGDHLVYRRNYLHDNRCQGFFVKDQEAPIDSVIAEDNLFVRNEEPCDGDPDCGPPAPFQVWGPWAPSAARTTLSGTGCSPCATRPSAWRP